MAKLDLRVTVSKRSYDISDTVTAYIAGMALMLDGQGQAVLAVGTGKGITGFAYDSANELSAPPTGDLITLLAGSGSVFYIDHSEEVAAEDADRAYDASVESAAVSDLLWVGADSKLRADNTDAVGGRAWAKILQVPSADNNFTLGVQLI